MKWPSFLVKLSNVPYDHAFAFLFSSKQFSFIFLFFPCLTRFEYYFLSRKLSSSKIQHEILLDIF